MKTIKLLLGVMLMLVISHSFTSCKKDDSIPDEQKNIKNTELIAVLKSKGFTIEGNQFLVNGKVRDTKSLDLSGSNLSDISGLEVFPNLEEVNLSNNKFGQKFDFSQLPETVKRVNLSDNEIYEFNGLAEVDVDNAKVTVLRKFEQLVFPHSARFNVETLPFYFKADKEVSMQMQNKDGKVEKYTTLREIPDENLRKYLKRVFNGRFEGDKLDIGKNFSLESKNTKINISTEGGFWGEPDLKDVKYTSLEGIEYIVNDPRYGGELFAFLNPDEYYTIEGYLKPGKKFSGFVLRRISTPILDLSNAESIVNFAMIGNDGLVSVDLSASKRLMQRGKISFRSWFEGDLVSIGNCHNLEEIKLPDLSKTPDPVAVAVIGFVDLPKLKSSIDLSNLQVTQSLLLGGLPLVSEIMYPKELLYFLHNGEEVKDPEDGRFNLNIDKNVYEMQSTKAFIKKYYNKLKTEVERGYDLKYGSGYFRDANDRAIESLKMYNYKK